MNEMTTDLEARVDLARALGHPARLRTLAMLRSGELCVCQVTEVLGLAVSTVSAHLKELRRAGLLDERKDGRWVYVVLAESPAVRPWLEVALGGLDDARVVADASRVAELRRVPVADLCRYGFDEAARRFASSAGREAEEAP